MLIPTHSTAKSCSFSFHSHPSRRIHLCIWLDTASNPFAPSCICYLFHHHHWRLVVLKTRLRYVKKLSTLRTQNVTSQYTAADNRVVQIFQKPTNQLEILNTRRVKWSKFRTAGPKISADTGQMAPEFVQHRLTCHSFFALESLNLSFRHVLLRSRVGS
jgi:hypothetical protein